jgi:DedD protein
MEICEHLPGMARWMHRSAILRAVHHKGGCHNEIPSFAGYESPAGMQELSENGLPPSMGSVCEYFKPAGQTLPAYVSLPNPLNVVGETGPGPGFLGPRYAPLQSRAKPEFDAGAVLNQRDNPPVIRGIPRLEDSLLQEGVTPQRLDGRRNLLNHLAGPFSSAAAPVARAASSPSGTESRRTATPGVAAASAAGIESAGRFVVQVGAFTDAVALREARQRVEKLGLKTYTQVIETPSGSRTRVRVGPFSTRAEAEQAGAKLKAAGLPAYQLAL